MVFEVGGGAQTGMFYYNNRSERETSVSQLHESGVRVLLYTRRVPSIWAGGAANCL